MTNGSHILARGDTHLPFALPRFGTSCAALLSRQQRADESGRAARLIASMNNGLMGCAIADSSAAHDHDDSPEASVY
jgi:hypothetical protein